MKQALAMLVMVLTPATTGFAADGAPGHACAIEAYLISSDAAAPEIRAGPSANAPMLATIGNPALAQTDVREQRDQWFRVVAITDAESGTTLFSGNGWMPASSLGIDISGSGDRNLYAEPRPDSVVLAAPLPDGSGGNLLDCSGDWAKIRFHGSTGWLAPSGQCSNPLTTCP